MSARVFAKPKRFAFLAESVAKTNTARLYGRRPVGECCVDHTAAGPWKTMTMLSTIREPGEIEETTMVMAGEMVLDY